MSQRCLVIRCDASFLIGSGHVMRCRTLAHELLRRGVKVIFLCRRQPGDLIKSLAQEFTVLELPELQRSTISKSCDEPLQSRKLYSSWLGCSQKQDAADCLRALAEAGIRTFSWLVVDHYGLDADWEAQMLSGCVGDFLPRFFVIDDLADRHHQTDFLLDQGFYGAITETRYKGLVPDQCRQLLGPQYALLGPEYAQLHTLLPSRTELRRVFVFFGGVDLSNHTSKALEALLDPELADLAVDVVLGFQCPHRQVVEKSVKRRPYTTLHNPQPSLAGLMSRADLAIGAGGATTWERACLGLPSLVVAIAENQLPMATVLNETSQITLLGFSSDVGVKEMRQALLCALRYPDRWPRLSGKNLTDGQGVFRISDLLFQIQ
ncbi:UDP-2,4-diacetamido-2,4,6-trideoxy-beta-L-altropyranose hydrolase [bacterium]|nr:UDP-2,4-diacetamido-2,4,6-trideoxy-beta-L-altropyranose hydrolase [bacterium]